jgi:hypothetical protein
VNAGTAIGAAAMVAAFLLPSHVQPWLSFFHEALMAGALGVLALSVLVRHRGTVRLPVPAFVAASYAPVVVAQWAGGHLRFGGDALLATLYLLGLAACVVIGAHWRGHASEVATAVVFRLFAVGALVSTDLALLQWLRLDLLGVFLADLPLGARPVGNIGQANHLATLLFLGLVSVWGLHLRGEVRGAFAWSAAAWLLLGIAMTQSRTGWLEVATLALAATVWRQRLTLRRHWLVLASLLFTFVVLAASWPSISRMLLLDAGLTLGDQAQAGRRPALWLAMMHAVGTAPWAGYGWTQTVMAQVLAPAEHALHLVFTSAHNLWLDLLLWNGLPLGLAACAATIVWFWRRVRRGLPRDDTLLLVALLGLLIHAQFEFPYAYAYFLLPAGLFVGMLSSQDAGWRLPHGIALACIGLLIASVVALTWDYLRAEAAWTLRRMQAARIHTPPGEIEPIRWLDQLQSLVDHGASGASATTDIASFRRFADRFPGAGTLYRLAVIESLQGRPLEAAQALRRLCAMHPPAVCTAALERWRSEADDAPAMRAVQLP